MSEKNADDKMLEDYDNVTYYTIMQAERLFNIPTADQFSNWNEYSKAFRTWCQTHHCSYYAAEKHVFSLFDAKCKALLEGNSIVIVESLS